MYEVNMDYDTCWILRENVTLYMSRKVHECYPLLVATIETGMEEEIICVPKTEQYLTLLDFKKQWLAFEGKVKIKY